MSCSSRSCSYCDCMYCMSGIAHAAAAAAAAALTGAPVAPPLALALAPALLTSAFCISMQLCCSLLVEGRCNGACCEHHLHQLVQCCNGFCFLAIPWPCRLILTAGLLQVWARQSYSCTPGGAHACHAIHYRLRPTSKGVRKHATPHALIRAVHLCSEHFDFVAAIHSVGQCVE